MKQHRYILIISLVILAFPLFQGLTHLIKEKSLKGYYTKPEPVHFSIADWFSGAYQSKAEKYVNDEFGFRSFFVRLNNQVQYSLFNRINAQGVVIGKENYLYESLYIDTYFGLDYIGKEKITKKVASMRFIQDKLDSMHKGFFVVIAAGKGYYYPEYFPDSYSKQAKGPTNYDGYLSELPKQGVRFIDYNDYFIKNRDKTEYMLYPKYGIHWSTYGECLVIDSLRKYIEKERKIDMPNFYWNTVKTNSPQKDDYDIGDALNLMSKLKGPQMGYPDLGTEDAKGKTKPSILVVSDSFFWGLINLGFFNAFSESHFWYYNEEIVPENAAKSHTDALNLKEEIEKHDIVVLMCTPSNLKKIGWGFIERTEDMFKGVVKYDAAFMKSIDTLKGKIRTDNAWMKEIHRKAKEKNVSVDSMITLDACWMVEQQYKKKREE